MAAYVIGDIQGHYHKMSLLLGRINFNPKHDFLYSVGDIVNRGEDSLAVLQWFYNHQNCSQMVLGNHDFYLIRLWLEQKVKLKNAITPYVQLSEDLQKILTYHDVDSLILWLCHQPLFHVKQLKEFNNQILTVVHAGFPPDVSWDTIKKIATIIADKINSYCLNQQWQEFLDYLNTVWKSRYSKWLDCVEEIHQESYILNCLTQIRWWHLNHGVLWKEKGLMQHCKNSIPWWYDRRINNVSRETNNNILFFGHWSAQGLVYQKNLIGLDSGVAWGRSLTIYSIENQRFFTVL